MSSRPNQQQQQQSGRGGRGQGGGDEERAGGDTVQMLLSPVAILIFGLVLIGVGGFVFYQTQIVPKNEEITNLESQISSKQTELQTKREKANLREEAEALVRIVDGKIEDETGRFLKNQQSQKDFIRFLFNDMIFPANITCGDIESIDFSGFEFRWSYKSSPFRVEPRGVPWCEEDEAPSFSVSYDGEPAGENRPLDKARPSQMEGLDSETYVGELSNMDPEQLRDTDDENLQHFQRGIWNPQIGNDINADFGKASSFTQPWNFTIEARASYREIENLVENMHQASTYYFSVQCVTNDAGETEAGLIRASSMYTIKFSAYYMNREASASGTADALPVSTGC